LYIIIKNATIDKKVISHQKRRLISDKKHQNSDSRSLLINVGHISGIIRIAKQDLIYYYCFCNKQFSLESKRLQTMFYIFVKPLKQIIKQNYKI
jgi:hypothetical protein